MPDNLSHKEKVALARQFTGGVEALRTPEYSVDCKTINSLFKKGYLDRDGLTAKAKAYCAAEGATLPMS